MASKNAPGSRFGIRVLLLVIFISVFGLLFGGKYSAAILAFGLLLAIVAFIYQVAFLSKKSKQPPPL